MKAIVTGANGFVGSHLIDLLVKNNHEVLAIDISFANSRLEENPMVKRLELSIEDIGSLEKLINKGEYDIFYHFAWLGSAGPLRADKNVQTKNALWTTDCLEVADKIGCKKFVCAGSIMEYEMKECTYSNSVNNQNNNLYAAAKSYAHELCKAIASKLSVDFVWAYITNTYGVGEISPRFINTTIRKIINNEQLEFSAATQNYDFVYIDDVSEAFYRLGLYGKDGKGYLIGSGEAKPLRSFIEEMCEVLDYKGNPVFGAVQSNGISLDLSTYSIKDLKEDCHYSAKVSFKEGIIKTKEWLEGLE